MPIKGLSDTVRMPRLGKIRLGVKERNEKGVEYPRAVDFFVCPDEVKAVYGEEPRELDIIFPVEDESRFASLFYRCYSKTRGLVCRGDGEKADRLVDLRKLREGSSEIASKDASEVGWYKVFCPGRDCEYYAKGHCREVLILQFLLPRVPGVGVWQLDTSSYHSIVNINSMIKLVRSICGRISGIPLKLVVEMKEVAPSGLKKRVPVLNLKVPYATIIELREMTNQLPPPEKGIILPPPEEE